jgi:hypothetical protein
MNRFPITIWWKNINHSLCQFTITTILSKTEKTLKSQSNETWEGGGELPLMMRMMWWMIDPNQLLNHSVFSWDDSDFVYHFHDHRRSWDKVNFVGLTRFDFKRIISMILTQLSHTNFQISVHRLCVSLTARYHLTIFLSFSGVLHPIRLFSASHELIPSDRSDCSRWCIVWVIALSSKHHFLRPTTILFHFQIDGRLAWRIIDRSSKLRRWSSAKSRKLLKE